MSNKIVLQHPKGMPDILPKDEIYWNRIYESARKLADLYDLHLMETPIVEAAELFEKSLGETTDVIEKQMFFLKNKGKDRLVLRPEGTASAVRAYIEHKLGYFSQPLKIYYLGPMFRHERSQAGRLRQFHHLGFEILGDNDPIYDVQIILSVLRFLNMMSIKNPSLQINSIGCRVCRPAFRRKIVSYYNSVKKNLCEDCSRRLVQNPLRLLDCKEEKCVKLRAKAPNVLNFLCQSCNNHYKAVLELIEDSGIRYELNPFLVRGLDYYSRTVFEIFASGFDFALAGGGRYDYLGDMLGGHSLPGVGGAVGLERVIEVIGAAGKPEAEIPENKVFLAAVGAEAKKAGFILAEKLRQERIGVGEVLGRKVLRAQLKVADREKVPLTIIIGQKEVFEENAILRDMKSGAQETISLSKLVPELKKRLKKA